MVDYFREFRRTFFSSKKRRAFFKKRLFRWWLRHAWELKMHAVIFVTALMLLFVSLWGYLFYHREVNRISDQFLRLQVFGPATVLADKTGPVQNAVPQDAPPFLSKFHLETRSPAGNPLSEAKIEFLLKNPDGTPLYTLSQKTDYQGCLDLEIPNFAELPATVPMKITATHGKKTESCEGMLRVRPRPEVNGVLRDFSLGEIFVRDDAARREISARYGEWAEGDWSRDVSSAPFLMSPPERMNTPAAKMEIGRENVISRAKEPLKLRLHGDSPGVPVIVCVWWRDFLVGLRPAVTARSPGWIEIPIPAEFTGLLAVTLYEYRGTPPVLAEQAFIFRTRTEALTAAGNVAQRSDRIEVGNRSEVLSGHSASATFPAAVPPADAVNETLDGIFGEMLTKEASRREARGSRVEFMSAELGTPGDNSEFGIRNAELFSEEAENDEKTAAARRNHAVSRVLLASLDWEPEAAAFPAETLGSLESVIAQILCGRTGKDAETRRTLARNALKLQAELMRGRLEKEAVLARAPLVYDGLQTLEAKYHRELERFQNRIFHGLWRVICMILCLACSLVLFVVMMSILRIPTGRNVWIAALAVVAGAFLLAWVIFSRADLRGDSRNVIFRTWMPEVTETREK